MKTWMKLASAFGIVLFIALTCALWYFMEGRFASQEERLAAFVSCLFAVVLLLLALEILCNRTVKDNRAVKGVFKVDWKILGEYYDVTAKYGPDSEQSRAVREKYKDVPDFIEHADRYDRLKRQVGGSGIDYPPQT